MIQLSVKFVFTCSLIQNFDFLENLKIILMILFFEPIEMRVHIHIIKLSKNYNY